MAFVVRVKIVLFQLKLVLGEECSFQHIAVTRIQLG